MSAGDVVLVHPDLAHAGGPNLTSGGVRMMVYFRVKVNSLSLSTSLPSIHSYVPPFPGSTLT